MPAAEPSLRWQRVQLPLRIGAMSLEKLGALWLGPPEEDLPPRRSPGTRTTSGWQSGCGEAVDGVTQTSTPVVVSETQSSYPVRSSLVARRLIMARVWTYDSSHGRQLLLNHRFSLQIG